MAITETTSLNAILSETGKIYLSVDGYGTLDQTGSVQILKKPDAIVRKAYLVGDGTNISSSAIGTTATLNGTTVNWDRIESTTVSSYFIFYSYLADVTDLLKQTIDSAASGTLNIALDEGSETYSYEGLALAVLFDDPNQATDNSVILYFGGLPTTGATTTINFSSPVDLSQVGEATLGLGIGFSYAAGGQTSQVSVNGQPLTLVAGNYDDGVSGVNNGALFTVGGLEDNPDNPSPVSTDPETDDELYNLLPFINNGDSSLTLTTVNPSNDDHIFFAHLTLEGIQTTSIPSTISFKSNAYEVLEDGSAITNVTLTRSGSVIGDVSVTLTPMDGTAIAGDDYDGTPIVVNFADGQTTAIVAIPIIDNEVYQGNKTLNLALSDPTNGAILGSQITSVLTIVEDDPQPIEKYAFTYFYGNGDSYSGYGYAPSGTYSVGQLPDYYDNETGSQQGYYVIDSVEDSEIGTNGLVIVTSYTDADTGFGTTTNLYSSGGYSGLGSEQGYAFNANPWNGDTYFSKYYEADLPSVLQVRLNLLADNDGTPGEILANDQIGLNRSFFVQIQVADLRGNAAGVVGLNLDFAWDGLLLESINFDPSLNITSDFAFFQDGTLDYDGFINDLSGGSLPEFEFGQAIGVNQLETFALLHFSAENNGTAYFTTTVNEASLADDNPNYVLDVETQQTIQVLSPYSQYNFTYYYGNGDSYTGYVFAVEGTYTEGQVLGGYSNETGNEGYYEIKSIAGTTLDSSYNGRVYLTSYTDADTGFGETTNIWKDWWGGNGYSGLGSEYGYAYDTNGYSSDSYFGGGYYEADILGNQLYNFTYYYGNGDSYSGYGYAAVGTYTAGQTLTGYSNETGNSGYYVIDSIALGNTSTGYNGYVYVTSYTDGNTGYGTTTNIGDANYSWDGIHGYSGLGSEYGYAYDSNGNSSDSYFGGGYWEADILNQYYTFTYTYGNGDSYSGYGYALAGTYTAGQTLVGYSNETDNAGYYTIDSISAGTTDSFYNNRVYVTSYFDGDTGFGTTTNLYSYGGDSGLGSEYGYAYDTNGNSSDSYFSNYWEADILGNQLYNFTYYYGNGDSYSGYGYAAVGTYTAGQVIGYYPNETSATYPGGTGSVENDTLGYAFYGDSADSVYHFTYTFTNLSDFLGLYFSGSNLQEIDDESWGLDNVRVTADGFTYSNDFETDALEGWSSSARSTTPIGSRNFLGEFGNDTVSLDLSDAALNGSVTVEFDLFILKSWDGVGNLGAGPDSFKLTTSSGQTLLGTTFAKYPGQLQSYPDNLPGYYVIDSVALGNTNTGYNGYVYLTSYFDSDTGFGTTTNLYNYGNPATYSGLGNEASYAYDTNGNSSDPYFSNYWEADILNQYYTFTYTYGNGDSYSGYGYALAGTYAEGQTLGGYSNETGNAGYYTINSVEAGTTDSSQNNRVYITSYVDGDTLYGETTNLYSYGGGSGLGSEYGYAYTSDGSTYDSLFSNYYEADLVTAGFTITDNSGNANDSSIKFTTQFPLRTNYAESDFVRPNFADRTKYFDITNTGTGILEVSNIVSNVTGVNTNFKDNLFINPGESKRIELTYAPSAAGEKFSVSNGLVLYTNALNLTQYDIALSGKSTFNSDINYDGRVGVGDIGPLNNAFKNYNKVINSIYDGTADINGDSMIDIADLGIFSSDRVLYKGVSLV